MNNLGLYLHVPFCKRKCLYCAFHSATPSDDALSQYARALSDEILRYTERIENYLVDSVYFGGGTPSLLSPNDFSLIFSALRRLPIADNAEITVECNPDSFSEDLAFSLASLGVNRISLGMQSSDDNELRSIGRLHNHKKTIQAANICRKVGIENFSLDLMLNLPGQTDQSRKKSILSALDLFPAHISVYGLKIEEDTYFFLHPPALPTEEEEWLSYDDTFSLLEENGFVHYEISNASRPGFESIHNQKYWNREDTLGIGPSAHSFFGGNRFYYPPETNAFLQGTLSPVYEPTLDARDILEETVMLGLRLSRGIDLTKIPLSPSVTAWIKKLQSEGYCRFDPPTLSLTRKGFFVSNTIIASLIHQI